MRLLTELHLLLYDLIYREDGQDVIEYALVVSLISFGAVSGMGFLATDVNHAMSSIAVTLTTDV